MGTGGEQLTNRVLVVWQNNKPILNLTVGIKKILFCVYLFQFVFEVGRHSALNLVCVQNKAELAGFLYVYVRKFDHISTLNISSAHTFLVTQL